MSISFLSVQISCYKNIQELALLIEENFSRFYFFHAILIFLSYCRQLNVLKNIFYTYTQRKKEKKENFLSKQKLNLNGKILTYTHTQNERSFIHNSTKKHINFFSILNTHFQLSFSVCLNIFAMSAKENWFSLTLTLTQ